MADVVNLRQARKRKRRSQDAREADANRLQFGRSDIEKMGTQLQRAVEERKLDGHRRAPMPDSDV